MAPPEGSGARRTSETTVRRSLSFPEPPTTPETLYSAGSGRYGNLRLLIGCVSGLVASLPSRPFALLERPLFPTVNSCRSVDAILFLFFSSASNARA